MDQGVMRRIIASVNTTLDGYMEGPNGEGDLDWLMPFVEDGLADSSEMLRTETDTILLGRITYQGFTQFWPNQEDDYADLMNKPRKLVFASPGALKEVTWGKYDNAQLIDRNVEEKVRELKANDGKDMVILASGGPCRAFWASASSTGCASAWSQLSWAPESGSCETSPAGSRSSCCLRRATPRARYS